MKIIYIQKKCFPPFDAHLKNSYNIPGVHTKSSISSLLLPVK